MKNPSRSRFASSPTPADPSIPKRRRPVQPRAQATREVILDATLQVLLRVGYPQLTTTRVAERAGVSVGTLYQYFADKTALVTALVERYLALMRDAVDEVVRRDPLDDPTLTLRRALAALLAVKLARLDLVLALRAPMAQLGGEQWVRASLGAFAASFAPLVRRALGPDPPEALIHRRAAIAVAAAEGAITAVAYDAPANLGEPWFLDEITAIAAAALRPPYTGAVDGG